MEDVFLVPKSYLVAFIFNSFGVIIDKFYVYSSLTLGWCPGAVTPKWCPIRALFFQILERPWKYSAQNPSEGGLGVELWGPLSKLRSGLDGLHSRKEWKNEMFLFLPVAWRHLPQKQNQFDFDSLSLLFNFSLPSFDFFKDYAKSPRLILKPQNRFHSVAQKKHVNTKSNFPASHFLCSRSCYFFLRYVSSDNKNCSSSGPGGGDVAFWGKPNKRILQRSWDKAWCVAKRPRCFISGPRYSEEMRPP